MERRTKVVRNQRTRRGPAAAFMFATAVLAAGAAALVCEQTRELLPTRAAFAQQVDRVVPPASIAGRMAPVDEAFALFIASSSLAQIEGARLVLKSTKNADMTDFAQRIVRDHRDTLERLRRIVGPRGLELPQAATGRHADLVTKLGGVAPAERDDAFIHRFGLDAHKEAIALTERHVKEGRDGDLKRYAEDLVKTLHEHMSAARKLAYAASAR
jgi:predicted outer membrane protein